MSKNHSTGWCNIAELGGVNRGESPPVALKLQQANPPTTAREQQPVGYWSEEGEEHFSSHLPGSSAYFRFWFATPTPFHRCQSSPYSSRSLVLFRQ